MRRVLPYILSIFIITQCFAETAIMNQDSNARSSANFVSRKNILAVIPKGTRVDVLDRVQLPSGNYGIKVKVTQLGSSVPTKLKVGDEVWVYYHANPEKSERVIALKNKDDQSVDVPTTATTGSATKSFSIAQTQAPASQSTASTATDCVECAARTAPTVTSPQVDEAVTQPLSDLQNNAANSVTEVVPSVEEIVAYIQKKTHKNSPAQLETYRKIAENVVKYCTPDPSGVLIPLVLSVMNQESNFVPTARSKVDAEGLMQLMPGTAADLAGTKNKKEINRYDIETSIKLGVKFMKHLLEEYDGNIPQVLIGYNAGEGAEKKIESGKKKMSAETSNYIVSVTKTLDEYASVMGNTSLTVVASNN